MDVDKITEKMVLIMPFYLKKKLLKEATLQRKMIKAKVYDLNTFMKEYRGEYEPITLYKIMKEESVSPSLAALYLSYLKDVEDVKYSSPKLEFLHKVKGSVREYFHRNPFIDTFLEDKEIIFYGYPFLSKQEEKFVSLLEKKYTVKRIENELSSKPILYRKYKTVEEEIASVVEEITYLLKEGTDINTVKIYVPNSSYRTEIDRLFTLFDIPFMACEEERIIYYDMAKYFLSLLENTDVIEALSIIRETYDMTDFFQGKLYQTILEEVTPFLEIPREDQIPLFEYLLSTCKIVKKEYTNCIEEITSLEEADSFTVFAVGISMGSFPKIKKEEDYLNEVEKSTLNLTTARNQNLLEREKAFVSVQIPKKLYLSYASKSPFSEYTESSLIPLLKKKNLLQEERREYQFSSLSYNTYLLTREMDLFRKYGEKTTLFEKLYGSITLPSLYEHQYHNIGTHAFHQYLHNTLILSYSSIDLFYRCPFRFYLSHILKMKENVETTSTLIGNIVHKVLYLFLKEKREVEDIIEEVFQEFYEEEINAEEAFYQDKYKTEIYKLISILEEQRKQTEFKEIYLEEEFSIEKGEKCTITLKGYIDKVLTFTLDQKEYVLIVDYKTGTITPNFNPVVHGLNMQLLVYYYLLKQKNPNYELGGCYWQNVMKEVLPFEKGKTYDRILREAYQWNGYTRKDTKLVSYLDLDTTNSFIKSLKLKKDGDFYYYAKVLEEREIEELLHITEKNIDKAIHQIEKASFEIKPKRIGYEKENTGCKFCPYQDICFKDPSDIVTLKEYKDLEFLKEVQNG